MSRRGIKREKFFANKENSAALNAFLKSPPGVAFLAVMEGESPLHPMADPNLKSVTNQHAKAKAQSDGECAIHILGNISGYETALNLIDQLQVQPREPKKKRSRKAGAPPRPAKIPST